VCAVHRGRLRIYTKEKLNSCKRKLFLNNVRFEAVTAVTMKDTVFWNMTPCSLVEVCLLLGGLLIASIANPMDEGRTFLRSVSQILPEYTASHLMNQFSSEFTVVSEPSNSCELRPAVPERLKVARVFSANFQTGR
jgi:hypothetical protein